MESTAEAGRSEVSARRGWSEGRVGRCAVGHAHVRHRRQQANFGWDRAGELVVLQVPAQRRLRGARQQRVMEGGARRRRRGWRDGQAGRGALPCTHRIRNPVISARSAPGMVPAMPLLRMSLRPHHGVRRWRTRVVVCECEKLAKGAQRLHVHVGRDICSAWYAHAQRSTALASRARIRDAQRSSKDAIPVVAQRSATVPARDPAIAEMKRGPRIRVAVDGAGDRHALRGAEDEDNKRAHQVPARARRQRGDKDRVRVTRVSALGTTW